MKSSSYVLGALLATSLLLLGILVAITLLLSAIGLFVAAFVYHSSTLVWWGCGALVLSSLIWAILMGLDRLMLKRSEEL